MGVINKIVGTHSQRELKRHNHTIEKILSLKPEMEKLTDDEMKAKTTEFRNRLQKGETLDDLLPEAFALVREATRRTLGTESMSVTGWYYLTSGTYRRNENR